MSQQQKPAPHYTYADYVKWPDEPRCELIHGVPVLMAPSPTAHHQSISMELSYQFHSFLRDRPCNVYAAPLDVRLNAAAYDDTVVQPDLIVLCDKSKLEGGKSVQGAPDLVIEILSPSTASQDFITKNGLYEAAGVPEYWIVDPQTQSVVVHLLENGTYARRIHPRDTPLPVQTLPGLTIDLTRVFPDADTP